MEKKMQKYKSKPVIKEAMQVSRRYFDLLINWIRRSESDVLGDYNNGEFPEDACFIELHTLEGTMTANEGDYVIKGLKGEFYPCREDIFLASYEKVQTDE